MLTSDYAGHPSITDVPEQRPYCPHSTNPNVEQIEFYPDGTIKSIRYRQPWYEPYSPWRHIPERHHHEVWCG